MKIRRDTVLIIIASALVVVFGVLYLLELNRGDSGAVLYTNAGTQAAVSGVETEPAEKTIMLTVHVTGEVRSPGVYDLADGSRVLDAVNAAGGHTDAADLNRVNLAAFISDAQQIVIPKIRAEGEADIYFFEEGDALININAADAKALTALPGIGDVIAGNIVSYRENNGNFKQISDIMNVPRIGERTFEQIRHLITVN